MSKTAGLVLVVAVLDVDEADELMVREVGFVVIELNDDDEEHDAAPWCP